MYCFGCLPKSEEKIIALRAKICIPRAAHRPIGKPVVHEHFPTLQTFVCGDCGTLVVKTEDSVAS